MKQEIVVATIFFNMLLELRNQGESSLIKVVQALTISGRSKNLLLRASVF